MPDFVMIKNYIKIAFRNIIRNKVASTINIFGLAIGLATAIIISLWIKHETSYAKCFDNHESLYLAYCEQTYPSGKKYSGLTSTALGPALVQELPEIKDYARTSSRKWLISKDSKGFSEVGTPVDSSFFTMFSLHFVKGSAANAFSDIHNIILSESLAEKIFGDEDPMDQLVKVQDWYDARVTGIYKDFPEETHFYTNYEFFVPFEIFKEVYNWNTNEWGSRNFQTYILLNPEKVDVGALSKKVEGVKKRHLPESNTDIRIQPITMMHLQDLGGGGLITYIYVLSMVAIFIILIACINYLNLSIAISVTRSREIGIRKVVGAEKKQLIFQFLTESILLALIAINFAVIIVQLSLPFINELIDKKLELDYSFSNILILLFFGIITGLIAGIYPAIIQSSFNIINCIKGSFKTKTGQLIFRKILVVFQFFLSVAVIIISFTINRQVNYALNKDLGYHKEDIICMNITSGIGRTYRTLIPELLASPYVLNIAASNTTLDSWESSVGGNRISWEGQEPGHILPTLGIMGIMFDFDTLYDIKIVDGRFFSPELSTDMQQSCLINETAVKDMGLLNPIGVSIRIGDAEMKVIGVVKDFHYASIHNKIEPLVIFMGWGIDMLSIRLHAEQWDKALTFVEEKFKEILPNEQFSYEVLEQNVKDLYIEEARVKQIMNISSILIILISCMGLFGLSSFMIERRFKEIGIRQVFGASISKIVVIFLSDFIKLVLIAIFLAVPVGYYFSINWLDNFAYKINLSWTIFAVAGLIVIITALLTVILQVYRASRKNPVDVLRYE